MAVLLAATVLHLILVLYGLRGLEVLNQVADFWLALIALGLIPAFRGPFSNDRSDRQP